MADLLDTRQAKQTTLVRNSLSDTSTCYYRTAAHSGVNVDWTDFQSRSHRLPRTGLVGTYVEDERVQPGNAAIASNQDFTWEVVFSSSVTSFNFFGTPWWRDVSGAGFYLGGMALQYGPVNDDAGDTQARLRFHQWDVSVSHIASVTVHSRPVVSSNGPHHAAVTYDADVTTDAVRLYIDGVNTETYTMTAAKTTRPSIDANGVNVGVEEFFTHHVGTVSNICITPTILAATEIQARANLLRIPANGRILTWDDTTNKWTPNIKAYDGSAWSERVAFYGNSAWNGN